MSLGNPLGNPLGNGIGNPLGLAMAAGGGKTGLQQGNFTGSTGSPNTKSFPIRKVNVDKAVLIVNLTSATQNFSTFFGLLDFSPESLTFKADASTAERYWPTLSWTILELPNVKKVHRIEVTIPAGNNVAGPVTFPEGVDFLNSWIVPVLRSTDQNPTFYNSVSINLGTTGFSLYRGAFNASRPAVTYQCQIVEFEK